MNYREIAKNIYQNSPSIKRIEFIPLFLHLTDNKASMHTASLYYHKYVHAPRKLVAIKGPLRDARGRFIKRVA